MSDCVIVLQQDQPVSLRRVLACNAFYRCELNIRYGAPGYYDSDYEFSSWYRSEEAAMNEGRLEIAQSGKDYERHSERGRSYSCESKNLFVLGRHAEPCVVSLQINLENATASSPFTVVGIHDNFQINNGYFYGTIQVPAGLETIEIVFGDDRIRSIDVTMEAVLLLNVAVPNPF
jgi:hypothetical protein